MVFKMDVVMKEMILVLMIMYILAPLDASPGPIDDITVFLIGLATTKRQAVIED